MPILKSLACFVLAAVCELSGAWLIWQWWRNGMPMWYAGIAGLILVAYGIVNTFQAANFGRSYAAYGGVFIAMALLWGWQIDHNIPDKFDLTGAALCLAGMSVIMFSPRYYPEVELSEQFCILFEKELIANFKTIPFRGSKCPSGIMHGSTRGYFQASTR